jgi:opacity protein-like surface antigen
MRRASLFGIVTSSALILTSTLGWADGYASRYVGPAPTNWILNSNNQFTWDVVGSHLDYLETLGGPLDTEKGTLRGASTSGSFMGSVLGIRNVYVFGQFTYLGDHTLHGEANPVFNNTRTDAQIRDEDFRLGVGLSLSRDVMLTPYLGFGEHYWLRNFDGVGGYREEYSNGYAGAGLLLQYSPIPRLVLSANGLIGGTIDSRLKATQNGGFPIPNQTFDLGGANIWKAGAGIDYAFTNRIHGNVGVDYTEFTYGQSPVGIGGFLEPHSRTEDWVVRIGAGYSFYSDLK